MNEITSIVHKINETGSKESKSAIKYACSHLSILSLPSTPLGSAGPFPFSFALPIVLTILTMPYPHTLIYVYFFIIS